MQQFARTRRRSASSAERKDTWESDACLMLQEEVAKAGLLSQRAIPKGKELEMGNHQEVAAKAVEDLGKAKAKDATFAVEITKHTSAQSDGKSHHRWKLMQFQLEEAQCRRGIHHRCKDREKERFSR